MNSDILSGILSGILSERQTDRQKEASDHGIPQVEGIIKESTTFKKKHRPRLRSLSPFLENMQTKALGALENEKHPTAPVLGN